MRKFLLISTILFLFACGNDFLYKETKEINKAVWTYQQPLPYEFVIEDTTLSYNLYLDLVHHTNYPFQNLYTKIKTTYPSGRTAESQISLELANKLGEWQGNCSSERCKLRVVLQEQTYFKEIGTHQLVFEQYTRTDSLRGVESVAFLVEVF